MNIIFLLYDMKYTRLPSARKQTQVLENAIDSIKTYSNNSTKILHEDYISSIGRPSYQKNTKMLIDVFEVISKKHIGQTHRPHGSYLNSKKLFKTPVHALVPEPGNVFTRKHTCQTRFVLESAHGDPSSAMLEVLDPCSRASCFNGVFIPSCDFRCTKKIGI